VPAPVETATAPLFVVLNAASGSADGAEREQALRSAFDAGGRSYQIERVDDPKRLPAAAATAAAKAKAQHGAVVAAGGDGTLNVVAAAALAHDVPFGALPQGTFNYFGRSYAIPTELGAAAETLLRSSPQRVPVGLLNGIPFLVNASLGLYPELLEDREQYKQRLGRNRAVAAAAGLTTLLREHRQLALTVEQGDQQRVLRTPTLFVGLNRLQLERLGLADDESVGCSRMLAIALPPAGPAELLWLALRGAFGTLGDVPGIERFAFRAMTVRPWLPYGRRRIKVAMDGEVRWLQTPLRFELAPRALQLLLPPDSSTPCGSVIPAAA
jgi:diacylglycerol kinase family enzyme